MENIPFIYAKFLFGHQISDFIQFDMCLRKNRIPFDQYVTK